MDVSVSWPTIPCMRLRASSFFTLVESLRPTLAEAELDFSLFSCSSTISLMTGIKLAGSTSTTLLTVPGIDFWIDMDTSSAMFSGDAKEAQEEALDQPLHPRMRKEDLREWETMFLFLLHMILKIATTYALTKTCTPL